MVVDDDEVDQMLYQRVIRQSGIATTIVGFTKPQEALEFLRDPNCNLPTLILLDIPMPGMNGFEFLDCVAREMTRTYEQLKVVMVSTSRNPSDVEAANQYAAVKNYLNKPITAEQVQQLARLLEKECDLNSH